MLARIYDAFDGDRHDLDLYVDLIGERGARHVLDIGCGTGSLAVLLARTGITVTGVDPAAASLNVAREKDAGGQVTWIHGDTTTLPPLHVDLAVMTGNVAQVFLTDDEWIALEFSLRQPRGGARNPTTDFREIVVLRTVRGRGYHSIAGEADWVTFETISQRPSRQDHTN